jgi:hypothetical protein
MSKPYQLKRPIGAGFQVDPDDVWATKKTLQMNGYYEPPHFGMTPVMDRPFIDAIKRFQNHNRLQVDGIMVPRGETETRIIREGDVAMTYWCTVCHGPHGGVYSTKICHWCWDKGFR